MRAMKDSGIEWIGEIPEDWNVKRVKAVLCERKYSLQGTTQGNGLTGGVPPVRFSM